MTRLDTKISLLKKTIVILQIQKKAINFARLFISRTVILLKNSAHFSQTLGFWPPFSFAAILSESHDESSNDHLLTINQIWFQAIQKKTINILRLIISIAINWILTTLISLWFLDIGAPYIVYSHTQRISWQIIKWTSLAAYDFR